MQKLCICRTGVRYTGIKVCPKNQKRIGPQYEDSRLFLMHYLPSKKIAWLLVGAIAVVGFLAWDTQRDEGAIVRQEKKVVLAQEAAPVRLWSREPNTSMKKISEISPTDNVLNYLGQIGQSLAGSQQSLVPEPSFIPPPDRFSSKDITVAPASEKGATYAALTIAVLSAYPSFRDSQPLETIRAWLESEDPALGDELRAQSSAYIKTAEALARVSVPRAHIKSHLDLMNAMDRGGHALSGVLETMQNPGTGIVAAAHFTSAQETIDSHIISLIGLLYEK